MSWVHLAYEMRKETLRWLVRAFGSEAWSEVAGTVWVWCPRRRTGSLLSAGTLTLSWSDEIDSADSERFSSVGIVGRPLELRVGNVVQSEPHQL